MNKDIITKIRHDVNAIDREFNGIKKILLKKDVDDTKKERLLNSLDEQFQKFVIKTNGNLEKIAE